MASRRTRIKGIANIPQRRKNTSCEEKCNDNLTNIQDEDKEYVPDTAAEISKTKPLGISRDINNCSRLQEAEANGNLISLYDVNKNVSEEREPDLVIETESTVDTQIIQQVKPSAKRRAFIKPSISASAVNRKPKQKQKEEKSSPKPISTANTEIASNSSSENTTEKSSQNDNTGQEVTLDEVHLIPNSRVSEPEVPSEKGVKKIIPYTTSNTINSDTEYPPPPPSPSKINRSRIKAIPRLGYRKTSFSASESEDESKRHYNRNRNDSVCSTASGVPESLADCMSPQRPKDFNTVIPKKCNRTEQSRKVAEARRDFQRRFGANKPDRQKLTMMDLIFYNPTSNPMVNEKSKLDENSKPDEKSEQMETEPVEVESEKVEEPQENTEEASKSDEENEMPVPQIKIGPSGEIILDEKSLVIEDKEGKRQREELQKTKLIDGDIDTGYGIYKRHKRAKDWTHHETLRFYKALNKIGTDFTLMCELFPRRTRRELKQKFKKEERINRALIDKAVTQPCTFQYTELKHEVDMEEKELEELRKQKEEEARLKKERSEERMLKKRHAIEKAEMSKRPSPSKKSTEPKPPKIRKRGRPKKLNIESVLEDSDADVSDVTTPSESEGGEEVSHRRTRSGKVPVTAKKESPKGKKKDIPEPPNIEPGSVMFITEKGPTGEPVHKLYMVTEDKDDSPLKLDSAVVSKHIQLRKGLAVERLLTISENPNRTIPADETVTTMRSIPKATDEGQQNVEVSTTSGEVVEGEGITTYSCEPSTSGQQAVTSESFSLEPSTSRAGLEYMPAPDFRSEPSTSREGMGQEFWNIMSSSVAGTSGEYVVRETYVPTEDPDTESD